MCLRRIDDAQAPSDHDGLVVAALHRILRAACALFEFPKIAQQIGSAKFVVKRGSAQRAFDHDL